MNTPLFNTQPRFKWQDEKRLRSGDRVWIITDAQCFTRAMRGDSVEQRWCRVGGLDLATMKLGYFVFSTDDVRAMAKAGIASIPWTSPQICGVEIRRHSHGGHREGRFRELVELIALDPCLQAQGPSLRTYFEKTLTFQSNAEPGVWAAIMKWAALRNRVEAAALARPDWFSVGDIKAIVGEVNVTPILKRLVLDRALVTNGKPKKAARYAVASCLLHAGVARSDWAS